MWTLIQEVAESLGEDWKVDAGGLQELGHYVGLVSGPKGMRLFFIAPTETLNPSVTSCPPLGWLRVDGRFREGDGDLSAKLSLTLSDSLTAVEMAAEIKTRLLPVYADFLDAIEKHNSGNHHEEGDGQSKEMPSEKEEYGQERSVGRWSSWAAVGGGQGFAEWAAILLGIAIGVWTFHIVPHWWIALPAAVVTGLLTQGFVGIVWAAVRRLIELVEGIR